MKKVKSENTKSMVVVNKKNVFKYAHIALIVLGSIFVLLSNFHTSIWFDESYSVGISNHSISEIWSIGSNDVHPVLYYIILHIIGLFTGNSILSFRLVSTACVIIVAILGYTHIRKDFGEKVGIIFSFLVLFMPVVLAYSGEIRMYTMAMLFVTIMAIYAYRIYKSGVSNKNWIIFTIFSLASCYTHYYALAAAFVINIALFLYFLINNIKQKNYEVKYKKYSGNLKRSIISAIVQIILYLPWLGTLISLTVGSSKTGFWIGKPDFMQIFEFQFTGNLDSVYLVRNFSYVFSAIILLYIIFLLIKYWKNAKPAKIALVLYAAIILLVGILSIIVTPILYARYFLVITDILLLAFAYLMALDESKIRVFIICTLIVIASCMTNIKLIQINYDKSNNEPLEFVQNNIQNEDIFLIDNRGSGFVVSQHFKNNELYFWDVENWNVDEAYKAFGNTIHNLDSLQDYTGRIWVISDNPEFLKKVVETFGEDKVEVKDEEYFDTQYKTYKYDTSLIIKKGIL